MKTEYLFPYWMAEISKLLIDNQPNLPTWVKVANRGLMNAVQDELRRDA